MIKMKCVRSTYALFEAGEAYDFKQAGEAGRFTVYEYERDGALYRFGLDDAGANETDGNFMQFEEVK